VLAALLSRHQIRGLAFFRSVLFLPQVIAMVVVGVAWRWMYADDGAVNQLLRLVGLDGVTRAWLGDFDLALPAVGLVGTWVMYGLCMLLFLSGAQKIDRSLYEAARMDGAGPVREFFAVTLPGLRQEVTVALTITAIYALRNFDLVYVTTNGGPGNASTVPAVEIYRLAFRESEVGLACAVAVVLMAITFAALLLITRLGRDRT
jgi:raffinose/stachyose/melibiose transport system permease protein